MQEKTKHHLFFYLHKLPFAAAIKNLLSTLISKTRVSENFSPKSSVDMLYEYHIHITGSLREKSISFLFR